MRNGKVYLVGATKGGVGKSVSSYNLAYSLAKLGKKVLAVDFDSQANMSTCFGVEDTTAVPITIGHLMMKQIEDEEMPAPEDYIQSRNGVDFIPSSMVLSVVDAKLRLEMGAEKMLSNILEPLKDRYDAIIIDTCPALGALTINALAAADGVIITVNPQLLAMMGLQDFLKTVKKIKSRINPKLEVEGILLTMCDARTNLCKVITEQVMETFEGHKIKEARTAQAKCLHYLGDRAQYKLLLTGTLITNHELDAFSQYRYLNRKVFGDSFYRFRNTYFDMVGYGNHIPRFRNYMQDDFLQKMHSIAFRVTKDECLDLPEIIEEVREIELEPKAMKMYQEIEKESYTELQDSEVSAVNVLTKLLRLSQLTGGHLTDDDGDCNAVSTAKLSALEDIVDSMLAENKKLVIMARFVPEMNDIQEMLEKKGIGYAAVRGGVKDRAEEIRRFQEDDDCMVFIGQIAAAGLGITLTAASTMVFYSMDYSMSNFEQAKARIHRVSQKNDCLYIYLIAKGTVDRKVLKSLRSKVDLAKLLVDDYRKGKNPFEV